MPGKGAVLHVQAGHLHSVGLVSGVDLNQNRATAGIVAIFYIIGGRVPVKSAAFNRVNRVEHGSFAVVVGVVHCARIPQGRVAPKGTVFQRVFLDIAVKGNRAAAQGRIVAVQDGFFLGVLVIGSGGPDLAEGHVLDGVVRQAVKGGVKGQRTAVGIGAVIGKGAAVDVTGTCTRMLSALTCRVYWLARYSAPPSLAAWLPVKVTSLPMVVCTPVPR